MGKNNEGYFQELKALMNKEYKKEGDSMDKWADYLVTEVHYNDEHTHIDSIKCHQDLGDKTGKEEILTRASVIQKLKAKQTFITAPKGDNGKLQKGQPVGIIQVGSAEYIRSDKNNIAKDNLDNLPEF